jgi:hypothetical protein
MTQKEAFDFLELSESATRSQIKLRLVEKLEYFQHLSEHAPSDFLRRIHSKNIDKVRAIQEEIFPWSSFESESEVILPLEKDTVLPPEEELNDTIEIVDASGYKGKKEVKRRPGPVAWLITHNENQPAIEYSLEAGKNYIGRKQQPGLTPFITLGNDPYVSRVHAVVYIDLERPTECIVMDSADSNNGQASKNGTYINGNIARIEKKETIKENETVQIGTTKLVFKQNTKDLKDLLSEVEKSDYVPTVAIN